jgi:transposase-like protein
MQQDREKQSGYFEVGTSFGAADRLPCPACTGAMTVIRRTPAANMPEFELQTFSCHQCGNEFSRTVDENGKPPKSG